MKYSEVELSIYTALAACGSTEDCSSCPLNSKANDESCAAYVMRVARNPWRFELRGGRVEPRPE